MSTAYNIQNISFSGNLGRPSTTKGAFLANDGTGAFRLESPTNDNQVLISDNTTSSGVMWNNSTQNSGYAFSTTRMTATSTSTYYFMIDDSSNPPPLVLPNSTAIFLSVTPSSGGWTTTGITGITGGTIEFTLGYTPVNTSNIAANWIAYTGGPHLTIQGTDINTAANNFRTFSTTLNITINLGEQVSVRYVGNLLFTPIRTEGLYNSFLLCSGT